MSYDPLLSVRVDPLLLAVLDLIADTDGLTRSQLTRRMLSSAVAKRLQLADFPAGEDDTPIPVPTRPTDF